jgi:hypothetical protein
MAANYFREEDEAFESFLKRVTTQAKETDLTEEKRKERRARCDNDDFEFCHEYFPEIFNEPWNPIHHHIKNLTEGEYGVSGCRLFGKTTFGIFAKIVKKICLGGTGLIGLALRNEKDSKERTALIAKKIRRNKKLVYDYSINFQQMKKGFYIINDKSFVSLGMREGLRNWVDDNMKRFELIVCDDLFNRQTVGSELDNEKVYNFVTSECSGQLEPGGLLLWFYNFITPSSPGSRFTEANPEKNFNLPAWNEQEQTNWPGSRWTTEALRLKKKAIPLDVWLGDWMNQPVLLGDIFDPKWLRPVNMNLINIMVTIAAVDPSFGKSIEACLKGAVIMGRSDKGKDMILDVYGRKESFDLLFDWLHEARSSFPGFRVVLWENDFAQWTIAAPYYKDWCASTKHVLPIVPYSSKSLKTENYGSDKMGRIMNLVHPHQTGEIIINEAIIKSDDYKVYQNQYISFGKATEKLDCLDAEATAYIMLPAYINIGQIKSLKDRRFSKANKEDSWLHGR